MKITKQDVIDAIRNEPLLQAGVFVSRDPQGNVCSVCAVGAVLRKFYDVSNRLETQNLIASMMQGGEVAYGNPYRLLDEGRLYNAVSVKFESTYDITRNLEATRNQTVDFVEKYGPEEGWDLP